MMDNRTPVLNHSMDTLLLYSAAVVVVVCVALFVLSRRRKSPLRAHVRTTQPPAFRSFSQTHPPMLAQWERWQTLTLRERAVAERAAEGKSNDEIAAELSVSRRTVEKHLEHVYEKLDIHSRGALLSVRPYVAPTPPNDTT